MARALAPAINESPAPFLARDRGRRDSGARVGHEQTTDLLASRVARESTEGNWDMDLVAIQIVVTAVLLIAHFFRVVWDRVSSPHER